MRITIPKWLTKRWQTIDTWLNEIAINPRRYEIRNIDILIAFGLVACVAYYWVTTGWQGAIIGGLLYILMAMMAIWIF